MLLAIDVGNSEVTIGVWNKINWIHHWRIPTRVEQPSQFYIVRLRDRFLESQIAISEISSIVISSVVPSLTKQIELTVGALFNIKPLILGPEVYIKLPVQVLNPYEIGSDLVANAVAAFTKYNASCVVVDFGTALTFTTVDNYGKILGVSIAPGLQTAIKALSQNTARLFDVPLEMPVSALGKSTVSAMQTGVLLGYEGLVKNVVQHIRAEVGADTIAVATGGLSGIIKSLSSFFHSIEPNLTLDGLRIIDEFIRSSEPIS